ncbi:hypothetical protein QFZ77_004933 [Paenibacillus sp. V4I3]|jgi:hypothetical protein|uniref:Uncharacterized protein n=1 Tax=Paenibacillus alginolyticus TaxID=59839 RepID=A0ABT4G6A3_9BACL|nr:MULTISPECIES: hypothetical protein [Paenibacillus]MCY9667763.1 hypothetical protein [Paenibacillus alginolyticus]MCY9691716.1 hypothetical protein [Paenibacillus alginolyticus]MDQ0876274.1 hypothetical protein [Paenibacillus sp. V4I3]MDQ0887694.1 hypothetical protein [Paenibacillus sp. V4I9]MEC0144066.1 hypothetical protein [Paenibacillus alginolyticus]
MTTNSGHQGAHGIGQEIEQLNNQAQAAELMQGKNKVDQEIIAAANEHSSELEEIIERETT